MYAHGVSKRLQVILDETDYREIQRAARTRHMSVAEWVRRALSDARRRQPTGSVTKKLEAIRHAAQYQFPTADIDKMLREIEAGYVSEVHP